MTSDFYLVIFIINILFLNHHTNWLGPTASGVPGEVKGFYEGWKKYGKLPWRELVQPSIDMAKKGFPFGYAAYKAAARSTVKPLLKKDPGLRFVKMCR